MTKYFIYKIEETTNGDLIMKSASLPFGDLCNTRKEAIRTIEKYGINYVDYTFLPVINLDN